MMGNRRVDMLFEKGKYLQEKTKKNGVYEMIVMKKRKETPEKHGER